MFKPARFLLSLFAIAACAGLLLAPTADAQQTLEPIDEPIDEIARAASYQCTAEIASLFPGDDCNNVDVTVNPFASGSIERTADVDMSSWDLLVVRVEVCNSSGWTFHVGDSPSNNGYGGDASDTAHDAEAYALNGDLFAYRSDIGGSGQKCFFAGPPSTAGCIVQEWIVRNDRLTFDSNANNATNIDDECNDFALFDLPLYDESDSQDPSGLYEDLLYVGLNRTYGSSFRDGTGVQRACFFVSTSTTVPLDSTLNNLCGF